MSAFYDTADAIAARLQADAALAAVPVVVDRQRDIASELKKAIGKQTGQGILIVTWTGGTNSDEMKAEPCLAGAFTVTGFFKPVIRRGDPAADDIIEAVCKRLHDWRPVDGGHFHTRMIVKGVDPIQHPELLALRVNLSCQLIL